MPFSSETPGEPRKAKKEYAPAIFRIDFITDSGDRQIQGTATLISQDGYFLASSHVVREDLVGDLRLIPADTALVDVEEFEVSEEKRGTSGYSKSTVDDDWVLIRAIDWPKRGFIGLKPVPLRYSVSDNSEAEGWFGGFDILGDGELEFRSVSPRSESLLSGAVFKGMSGSLLIDNNRWGFGLVGAHGWSDSSPGSTEHQRLRKLFDVADTFGHAKLESEDGWWQVLDPDGTFPVRPEFKKLTDELKYPPKRARALSA